MQEDADTESVESDTYAAVRCCNVKKVLNVAKAKARNSKLATQFVRFAIFLCLYTSVLYLQREGYVGQSAQASMSNELVTSTFRDPSSLEHKTWPELVTVDDFWNWHLLNLLPRVLVEAPDSPGK